MLVDSHCHLEFPDFAPEIDAVVARARAAGVEVCLSIGTKLESFARVREIAGRFDNVWCSVGIHPHEAEKEPIDSGAPLIALTLIPRLPASAKRVSIIFTSIRRVRRRSEISVPI